MDSSIDHRGLAKLCGIDGIAARLWLGARRGRAGPALPQGHAIFVMTAHAPLCIVATLAAAISLGPPARASDPIARDIAAEIGLNYRGALVASTEGESPVFDYDGDGDLDILLSMHGGSPWPLMQNQGDNTFIEALNGTFFKADRHGCVAGDFGSPDGAGLPDGLPDLYCVTGACQGKCTKAYPNSLFLQRADRTFVDVAAPGASPTRTGAAASPWRSTTIMTGARSARRQLRPVDLPGPQSAVQKPRRAFRERRQPGHQHPRYSLCATRRRHRP